MSALRKRANAFEAKYAHEQDMVFMAEARCNAVIGRWAAGALQHPDPDAYVRSIVSAGVEHPDQILDLIHRDFDAAGVIFSQDDIIAKMAELLRTISDELYSA